MMTLRNGTCHKPSNATMVRNGSHLSVPFPFTKTAIDVEQKPVRMSDAVLMKMSFQVFFLCFYNFGFKKSFHIWNI